MGVPYVTSSIPALLGISAGLMALPFIISG